MRTFLLILFLILSIFELSFAQIVTRNNTSGSVTMQFLLPKIEAVANESFFNILIVKNNSNSKFIGKIKYTQPANWSIIGEDEVNLSLSPNDSVKLPVRVIVSKSVFGEIAYAVVASMYDINNQSIRSEYCFINIPRITNLKIKAPKNIIYFDNKTETAKFQYAISNEGNTNEIVQINLTGDEHLSVDNQLLNESYVYDYNIPAHTDTIVEIGIKLEKNNSIKDFYKIDINTFSQDSIYKSSIWLNQINATYDHVIPEYNKCAIIELSAHDILSTRTPTYSLFAKGSLLLKRNTDIYYYFRKNDLSSDWDTYKNMRAYIGVKTKHAKVQAGTFDNVFHEHIFGVGGMVDIYFNKYQSQAFYVENNNELQTIYGGQISFPLINSFRMELGYAEKSIELYKNYTNIFLSGLSFRFLNKNRFSIRAYGNKTTHALITPFDKIGYAILSDYSGNFRKIRANFRIDYGSPEYSGITRGRVSISARLDYLLNSTTTLFFKYDKRDFTKVSYINDVLQPIQKQNFDSYQFTYNKRVNKFIDFYIGSEFKTEGYNSPYLNSIPDLLFKTINTRFFVQSRISLGNSVKINPRFDAGNIQVTQALDLNNSINTNYYTYNFYLNIVSENLKFLLQYRNGPLNINEQYYFYYLNYYTKWLFIMPSYDIFLFNNTLNFNVSANYRMDVNSKESDLSIYPQLTLYLPNFWSIRFLTSISTRKRVDAISNSTLRYTTSYFELAIRKEFSCKQPRFQYHDLNVVFFKDLNGNRIKEPSEPGLRNVLASIEHDYSIEDEVVGDFISTKLLTSADGVVTYTNMVSGNYIVKYILIGDMMGNFNREEMVTSFRIDEDKTLYIPYVENNRIVGKVILNRDPLSSYGNIDISNIRVIAEDTKGHTYSALTDKYGNFILYTPVTDYYVVKINNIFYENFDLQQPEFVVKFNGYKQFEVTFVFDEKKRKINFESNISEDNEVQMDDLKAIRKTTLSGKIRDAISLDPVDAQIEIIDNKTGKNISNTISNRLNGNYSISYVAGDNFRIEVKADGYWDHVENLYIEQVISIQNIAKDIMLNKTSEGPKKQTFIIYDEKEEDEFTENFKAGQKIPMNNLNFNEKETRLSPDAYPELDRLIDLLNKNKSVRIQVGGHADDTGKERTDNLLANRRANAVARYLKEHGLEDKRIEVISYSNKRPLIPGSSEKAKQKNRRVEIIVL